MRLLDVPQCFEQMETLTRLRIQGFRSIRDLDLPLGMLTVLIGANGSGKSNFIGFFNMLGYMLTESLQVYVGRRGGGSSILHYGPKRTPVMSAELEFKGESGTSSYGFTMAFASPDSLLFTDEHVGFQYPDKNRPYEGPLGAGHFETKLTAMAKDRATSESRKVARIFVNRLRELRVYHFHDTSEGAYIRTQQDLERNRSLMSNGGNLAAFLYLLQESKPHHFAQIIETVRLAVPYLKSLILEPDRLSARNIQLRWTDDNPDYEFGAHQLSDGSLRAIALITALLQPDEMLPSVIFIDEPELGLHPAAIGVVASLIKSLSSKRQVIVATQSPRFLAEFSPDDVVVAERKERPGGYGESTYRRLVSDDLLDWLEDYDLGDLYEKNVTGGWPK